MIAPTVRGHYGGSDFRRAGALWHTEGGGEWYGFAKNGDQIKGKRGSMSNRQDVSLVGSPHLEEVRNFLCSYQLCLDMLNLRRYERKRAKRFSDPCDCADILSGDEAYWRARMFEVGTLISRMPNGREKLVLYWHYVKGESFERIAGGFGCSRRTSYRLHMRALERAAVLFCEMREEIFS